MSEEERKKYPDQKGLRKHTNADIVTKTRLTFPEHVSQSGICSICIMDRLCEIGKKSKEGRTVFPGPFGTTQFGAEKRLPNIEDIQIIPELFGEEVNFKKVKTEMKLGGFDVSMPITIAAMGSTKVAHDRGKPLAAGAAKAGIPMVIGENMLATHGKDGLEARMKPFLENYKKLGALIVQGNPVDIKMGIFETGKSLGAHGIEVKLGQGAKPGLGGEIKFEGDEAAQKYRKYGYEILRAADGKYERHTPVGSLSETGLRDMLIKASKVGLPIWIKACMGKGILKLLDLLDKIKKEQGIPLKCVTVDGFGGGTGMSPWLIMNECGIPSPALFMGLDKSKKKMGFDILLAGGFGDGVDVAKGIMLGANGVAMGRAMLIAASEDMKEGSGVLNFSNAIKEELQMICATQRINSVEKLVGRRDNLFALNRNVGKIFGISSESKDVI